MVPLIFHKHQFSPVPMPTYYSNVKYLVLEMNVFIKKCNSQQIGFFVNINRFSSSKQVPWLISISGFEWNSIQKVYNYQKSDQVSHKISIFLKKIWGGGIRHNHPFLNICLSWIGLNCLVFHCYMIYTIDEIDFNAGSFFSLKIVETTKRLSINQSNPPY